MYDLKDIKRVKKVICTSWYRSSLINFLSRWFCLCKWGNIKYFNCCGKALASDSAQTTASWINCGDFDYPVSLKEWLKYWII